MKPSYRLAVAILVVVLMPGCEIIGVPIWNSFFPTTGPQYQSDFELVNELKEMNVPSMKSGEFAVKDESLNKIYFKTKRWESPYDESYAEYIKYALEEELKQSDLWDQSSKIVISGTLVKNEFDVGVYGGESDISAIFVVTKDGRKTYNKAHTIHHEWEWESASEGGSSNSIAKQNYVISIQKLLRDFFLDKELLIALEK